jgi:FAD/FMN-containing dehydrogenase
MTDLRAISRTGEEMKIERRAVEALAKSLHGELLTPESPDYAQARLVWNGMIDRRPALIARCTGAADVVDAVNFAREQDLLVAVRGGGHNVAGLGTCDGGMVIDLSPMRHVGVDPEARRAWVAGGARLGDLDRETQLLGWAVPAGVVSDTGVAGLTLGGGAGHLAHKYGLTCDALRSAQVVTAAGEVVRASEDENADLFWGLRGGGGNFGIVTAFEFEAYPVGPEVSVCFAFYPREEAMQVISFFRDWFAEAPDEVSGIAFTGWVPEAEGWPVDARDKPAVGILAVHCGPVEKGERVLQPLREIATPLVDLSSTMRWLDLQRLLDEDYPSYEMRYYWKSTFVNSLEDEVIETILERAESCPSKLSTIDMWASGGAVARVGEDEMAFSGRTAPYIINPESNWLRPEDDEANVSWTRETWSALREFSSGGVYFNFPGGLEEGQELIRATFGSKQERLSQLKSKYDPQNLFHLNQNIQPAAR